MAIVLGIDVESTGLLPDQHEITEIGAVLWDTDLKTPLNMFSSLMRIKGAVPAEITTLTGIDTAMLGGIWAKDPIEVLCEYAKFVFMADYLVAHNAGFDRSFLEAACTEHGIDPPARPWIDTKTDVPYPDHIKSRSMTYLAADHGFINPLAHRALLDVLSMLKVMSMYPFGQIVALSRSPVVELVADVSFDNRHLAKEAGFHWQAERKLWTMECKECHANREFGFRVYRGR